jgi:hypothetical protein
MATPMTVAELQQAQSMIASGDLSGFYAYMSDMGYNYAVLAEGLISGSLTGTAAINYLVATAQSDGTTFTSAEIPTLESNMANAWVGALIQQAESNGGEVTQDLTYAQTYAFHASVFENLGLNPDVWTLTVPGQVLGSATMESLWDQMLDELGSNPSIGAAGAVGILTTDMAAAAANTDGLYSDSTQYAALVWLKTNIFNVTNGSDFTSIFENSVPPDQITTTPDGGTQYTDGAGVTLTQYNLTANASGNPQYSITNDVWTLPVTDSEISVSTLINGIVINNGSGANLAVTSQGGLVTSNSNIAVGSGDFSPDVGVSFIGGSNNFNFQYSGNYSISGGGNLIALNGNAAGSTFTLSSTGADADTLDVAGATDITALLGDETTMVDLGINSSLTISSLNGGGIVNGTTGDDVSFTGNNITLNASGGQYVFAGSGYTANMYADSTITFDSANGGVVNDEVTGQTITVSNGTFSVDGDTYTAGTTDSITVNADGSFRDALYDSSGVQTDNLTFSSTGDLTQDQQFSDGVLSDAINYSDGVETDEAFYNSSQQETANAVFNSSGQQTDYDVYDPSTGQLTQDQQLQNGVVVDAINYTNGVETDEAFYNSSQQETSDDIFNSSGQEIQQNVFTPGSSTPSTEIYFDPSTGIETYQNNYDPSSGQLTSQDNYNTGGQLVSQEDYNDSGQETEQILVTPGTTSITTEIYFDPSTGIETYQNNYDPSSGQLTSQDNYNTGGQLVSQEDYNPSGQETEQILVTPGTTSITNEIYYDPSTGVETYQNNYDPSSGQLTSQDNYNTGGQLVSQEDYNPSGQETEQILVQPGTTTPTTEIYFDPSTGIETYQNNYDPSSGQLTSQDNYNTGGQLVSQENYNSAGQETEQDIVVPGTTTLQTQIFFDSNGSETYQNNFTDGVNTSRYFYNPDGQQTATALFGDDGKLTEYGTFDASGQLTQDIQYNDGVPSDVTNYSNGVAQNETFYNPSGQETQYNEYDGDTTVVSLFSPGASYSDEQDTYVNGTLTQSNTYDGSTGQLQQVSEYNGGPYPYEVETADGGTYFSQIEQVDPQTGAILGVANFDPQTGQVISASGSEAGDDDGSDDDDDDDDGGYFGGYSGGYFGGYGFAGKESTVQTAVGSNIGSIAQGDLTRGNQTGAAAAEAALQQAYATATATPTTGTGTSALEGARWDSQVITWSFAGATGTNGSSTSPAEAAYESEIQQAFATWAKASGLIFEEVAGSAQADINIGFGELNTATTGVVGYTTYQAQAGQMAPGANIELEDPNQDALVAGAGGQLTYSGTEATLEQVLLHEIGHALGLADNSDQSSIMYYALSSGNQTLDSTDIAGIQSLYGPGSVPPASTSSAAVGRQVDQMIQAMAAYAPMPAGITSLAAIEHLNPQAQLAVAVH